MSTFVRRDTGSRFYWAQLAFLLLGIIGLKPSVITDLLGGYVADAVNPQSNLNTGNVSPINDAIRRYQQAEHDTATGNPNASWANVNWPAAYANLATTLQSLHLVNAGVQPMPSTSGYYAYPTASYPTNYNAATYPATAYSAQGYPTSNYAASPYTPSTNGSYPYNSAYPANTYGTQPNYYTAANNTSGYANNTSGYSNNSANANAWNAAANQHAYSQAATWQQQQQQQQQAGWATQQYPNQQNQLTYPQSQPTWNNTNPNPAWNNSTPSAQSYPNAARSPTSAVNTGAYYIAASNTGYNTGAYNNGAYGNSSYNNTGYNNAAYPSNSTYATQNSNPAYNYNRPYSPPSTTPYTPYNSNYNSGLQSTPTQSPYYTR